MQVLHVDPAKHAHPNQYRRALRWLVFGVIAGLSLTGLGLYVATYQLGGAWRWLSAAILLGPSLVFLAFVAFSTYLERLEQDRYGAVYQSETHPGTMADARKPF